MSEPRIFDNQRYQALNEARAASVREFLAELRPALNLHTAADVGCGLGYFSGVLRSLGFQVVAVDGRPENIEEAHRRLPDVSFHAFNAEDPELPKLGRFDLVFCFGLLYHLENPFQAVRHLFAMTAKLLLVESVCFPGAEPVLALVDEARSEDQGLNYFAFYPSEACLVKMLYRAGFGCVYRLARMPDHQDFHTTASYRQVRTMLAAAHAPLSSSLLALAPEPSTPVKPWDGTRAPGTAQRLWRFALKSWPEKIASFRRLTGRHSAT